MILSCRWAELADKGVLPVMHDPNILNNSAMTNRSQLDLHLASDSVSVKPSSSKRGTLAVDFPTHRKEVCARNGSSSQCSAVVSSKTTMAELKQVRSCPMIMEA